MKIYKIKNIILFSFLAILITGCTETYPLLTNTFEEIIVVEATITNELKNQEIKITKTAKFEDENYLPETGAKVFITDDAGNQYDFKEDSGTYISVIEFQAQPERKYQLHINTKDGRTLESSTETLTAINPMQNVVAAVEKKDSINGVSIRINSFDPEKKSKYYRYEYEETYKVVAPKWIPIKGILDENSNLQLILNSESTQVCYGNKKSTDLLLANTNNLSEDRVDFMARFISDQDYIITTRYSILVKQYVESLAAYNYYATLKKISGSGSILSPVQPGFLLGNIQSVNSNNKVAGYFDVASVSTERIYFNYSDLFPGQSPPPYAVDCLEYCYGDFDAGTSPVPCSHTHPSKFRQDLGLRLVTYYSGFDSPGTFSYWVNAPCGDCTTIASNIKPTFWTD